jgi:hypothetical protein
VPMAIHPMRGTLAPCCARAASGYDAAATPSSDMNSRRLIAFPGTRQIWLSTRAIRTGNGDQRNGAQWSIRAAAIVNRLTEVGHQRLYRTF